jgi:hypothetical protein
MMCLESNFSTLHSMLATVSFLMCSYTPEWKKIFILSKSSYLSITTVQFPLSAFNTTSSSITWNSKLQLH